MDYFRNIVVVAALAGAIAGLGMTIAQQLSTVPLILKAEVYEEQSAAPVHEHGDAGRAGRARMSMAMAAGRRPTASSARPSPSSPISSPASALRCSWSR